jgi:hypothetical protein
VLMGQTGHEAEGQVEGTAAHREDATHAANCIRGSEAAKASRPPRCGSGISCARLPLGVHGLQSEGRPGAASSLASRPR